MGSVCSRHNDESGASRPAQSPKGTGKGAVSKPLVTSTVYRERLINLHDKARRQPSHDSEPQSIPEEEIPTPQYQRFANVFAAPLKLAEDFIAPIFSKSAEENDFLKKALSDNFIFAGLTPQEYTLLINAMHHHSAAVGDVIMQQGDLGDYFYVLKSGQVAFIVNGKQVGEGHEGATFGELALLYDAPRAATVRAVTDCSLYRVDQKTFRAMLANNKARSGEKRVKLLREVEIFNGIDSALLHKIADAMTDLVMSDGEKIFRKGEVGEVFYIISSGKVKITDIGLGDAKYVDQVLNPGDFFGERALMTGDTRAGTATALGNCSLLCISKDTFDTGIGHFEKLMTHSQNKRNIMGVPIFAKAKLDPAEVERLSKRIVSVTFPKDMSLLEEGKPPTTIQRGLYIIKEGEIAVSSSSGVAKILKSGDYFGEDLILEKPHLTSPCNYVVREAVVCDVITVEDIKSALNGLARLEREGAAIISTLDSSITLKTLNKVKMLGSGTFGQVWLVTHNQTKNAYALKVQIKRELIDNGQAAGVVREKNLMAALDHPFVIKLVNAFQDEESLFMVMKLAQGGELYSILHTAKSDGVPESSAKFYAATIFDGLMHMHERRILYRDLKPENVLIDTDGYCVLIDLGFAKVVTEKTYTLCGTPLYLAPEIILSRGYDKCVDNWSFGVLIFEMIYGYSPFYSPNIDQITLFKRIVRVQYSFPHMPSNVSEEARDLISRILVLNPARRLGSLANGDADIRYHQWLAVFSPSMLTNKEVRAPWKPKIKSSTDASNFDDWSHLKDKQNMKYAPLSKKEQDLFKDF